MDDLTHRAIISRRADFGWFVLPGIASALWGTWLGLTSPSHSDVGLGLWIVGVLLVDVVHVWASLYRTYLDPVARRIHRNRLIWAPLLCAWFGTLLHLESPLLFWSVLAYLAIFHFIKQHVGFAMLYARAGGEAVADRKLVELAIWAGTLGPVVYWHTALPRNFAWFLEGDFVSGVPSWLGPVVLWAQLPVWISFFWRRVQLRRRGQGHWLVPFLVLVPAINWHLGIVVFNDDRVFTITNVFLHGLPYLALVWVAGGRRRVEAIARRWELPPTFWGILPLYYGLLVLLATFEEALWDRLIWHDHPELFGVSQSWGAHPLAVSALVGLLTVPQATHYFLDRWIWRVGPQNPDLASQLGLGPSRGDSDDVARAKSR